MTNLMLTIIILAATFFSSIAQNNNHFEIEIDPLAYSLGGASGHIAFTWKNDRIQLGYGQLTLPEAMQNHENVRESFKAISLKWDYFFGKSDTSKGFFSGPTMDYLFLTYKDDQDNTHKDSQLSLGLRVGYKIDLFKNHKTLNGLYLTPWISTTWLTNADNIQLGEQSYTRKAFNLFPTFHIGWSF